jgi:hypothetical protein
MNERIKEFEAQCWEARQYGPPWFDAKKFAELIVRECAGIAKKEQAFNAQYTDANMHPQVNIDQCILMGFGL